MKWRQNELIKETRKEEDGGGGEQGRVCGRGGEEEEEAGQTRLWISRRRTESETARERPNAGLQAAATSEKIEDAM